MAMDKIKILSDFDGVWTSLEKQSSHLFSYAKKALSSRVGVRESDIESVFLQIEEKIRQNPSSYGWPSIDGRLRAFSDEDPFLLYNTIVPLMVSFYPEKGDFFFFNKLAEEIFKEGMTSFKHDFFPKAPETLAFFLQNPSIDFIICSNSPEEKIRHSLQMLLPEIDLKKKLRIYGEAKKFMLSDLKEEGLSKWVNYGDRQVHVDRPFYLSILEKEKPHLVLGDVFSLDLSLPLLLGIPSILCVRDYTPSWALQLKEERLSFMTNFKTKEEWERLFHDLKS